MPLIIGGSVIFTHAGDDMTDVYNAFHPPSANDVLAKFEIGELDESVIPTGLYANKLVPQKQKDFESFYINFDHYSSTNSFSSLIVVSFHSCHPIE